MKKYSEYKDSGVEWIGEIPKEWEVKRLKYIFQVYPKCNTAHLLDETKVTFMPMDCVKKGYFENRSAEFGKAASSYNYFENGDILLAKVTPCFENGNIAIAGNLYNEFGFGSSELFVIRSSPNSTKYLFYYFQTDSFKRRAISTMYGVGGLKRVSALFMKDNKMALPAEKEQLAIANYLDRKTAGIDTLIADKQKLIDLLREKRQATISEAVTKGLDKTVKMKDSGIDWIGEIPESWEMSKSRWLFAERKERAKADDIQLTASQQFGIMNQKEFMAQEGQRVVQVIKGDNILKHVEVNDFVISMRSFQGGIEWSGLQGKISSAYVMLIPNEKVYPQFFKWLLKTPSYIQALQSTSNLIRDGQALRYANFKMVDLPVVPIEEQVSIAEYLNDKTAQTDSLISDITEQIEKLKEYRQSIISEAVTGKVAV